MVEITEKINASTNTFALKEKMGVILLLVGYSHSLRYTLSKKWRIKQDTRKK
jgi:hypothetical protein